MNTNPHNKYNSPIEKIPIIFLDSGHQHDLLFLFLIFFKKFKVIQSTMSSAKLFFLDLVRSIIFF